MKRLLAALLCAAVFPAAAFCQAITMEDGYVAFDYPDSWLVVSPQRCRIYAPILRERGVDPEALAAELEEQSVLSRALNEDGSQAYSVLATADDTSREIFDMGEATDEQRRRLKSRAENNTLWERTGLRTQDAEWQVEGNRYWLYIHYTEMRGSEVLSRGLRYVTIHNGLYVMLDWRLTGRRFSNRDLSAFRRQIANLSFLETLETPRRTVQLTCELPTEINDGQGKLSGTATPGAQLTLTADDGKGNREEMDSASAGARGSFTLEYLLPREGEWTLELRASAEGMDEAVLESVVAYSENTLPVSGIEETIVSTADKVTLSGRTLPAAAMQLVTPYGLTKKRAENDGSFSFELTTRETGSYNYTLLIDKKGYTQRRIHFTVVREQTDEQERADVRAQAVRIAYKDLIRDLPKNRDAILNLHGYVQEVSQAGETAYIRMMYTKDAKGVWSNPVIIVCEGDPGVKAHDMLTCTVRVEGVYEEQDARGEAVSVPRLRMLFTDKIE